MICISIINRALIFQGGGSLGAYEAGAYKAMNEDFSAIARTEGRGNEPLFHIVSGTSIGAINAALLVSYVKENKTWEGSGERLIEFWEYLSTESLVENIPYFMHYWDSFFLKEKTKAISLATGKKGRYDDLVRARVDVDFVARLERKNDAHTISNKTFDFSKTTIRQLIQNGYDETKEQMKEVLASAKKTNG